MGPHSMTRCSETGGNNTFNGNDGNDFIRGRGGDDTINGRPRNRRCAFRRRAERHVITPGGAGILTVAGTDGMDTTLTGVELLQFDRQLRSYGRHASHRPVGFQLVPGLGIFAGDVTNSLSMGLNVNGRTSSTLVRGTDTLTLTTSGAPTISWTLPTWKP